LRYVDLRDESPLFETRFPVNSDDPLASVELVLQVPPFPLPHAGVYAFEVLNEDNPIGSLRITVVLVPEEGSEEEAQEEPEA
jgi:hypothetical protein